MCRVVPGEIKSRGWVVQVALYTNGFTPALFDRNFFVRRAFVDPPALWHSPVSGRRAGESAAR